MLCQVLCATVHGITGAMAVHIPPVYDSEITKTFLFFFTLLFAIGSIVVCSFLAVCVKTSVAVLLGHRLGFGRPAVVVCV